MFSFFCIRLLNFLHAFSIVITIFFRYLVIFCVFLFVCFFFCFFSFFFFFCFFFLGGGNFWFFVPLPIFLVYFFQLYCMSSAVFFLFSVVLFHCIFVCCPFLSNFTCPRSFLICSSSISSHPTFLFLFLFGFFCEIPFLSLTTFPLNELDHSVQRCNSAVSCFRCYNGGFMNCSSIYFLALFYTEP